ncbi:PhnD/SsuA/transferrin family substrate-binding protein [Phyllobacterium endophyticum]|uniref:Phosphonate-binding protein n=1 Tax=Phyllobacterium endophyticum TaxID=1149773 RepID=A0A2P7AS81_9HYPH|nr:PhnD/SsuA/transferrin family substrate-binding protein [Phyllobacterium endophyticum]MBB3236817.1 phosphonate transport system substrate-binding protein [Phyllobacterium endophyticum]PSH57086.1 phosphonate-binding protein [Phyllobacterium endophyticum]TYR40365.1 PhnD/SsuA/transferrin family substrate-binding protein [Phyllobacterium endophyticum]
MIRTLATALAITFASIAPVLAAPVKFAVTDMEGLEALQQEFGAFQTALEEATGLDIELYPVSSRTTAVEAMNSGQVDLVLTGPAEYVVMKELSQPRIVVAWQRPDYFAQIAVLANGPIRSIEDLKGKKVAFGSVGSTSQHLGPAQALADFNLKYTADYEPVIISRNIAAEALIRGDIAAIGLNFGHLNSVREAFPDIAFSVVARGRDLPNDILVARKDIADDVLIKVRKAFAEKGTELMNAVLNGKDNQKFKGGFFLTEVKDSDYDYVRSMYRTIGIESFTDFVN